MRASVDAHICTCGRAHARWPHRTDGHTVKVAATRRRPNCTGARRDLLLEGPRLLHLRRLHAVSPSVLRVLRRLCLQCVALFVRARARVGARRHAYIVVAHIVMAHTVMASILMACIVMAHRLMARVVVAYVVMADTVMTYIVMARVLGGTRGRVDAHANIGCARVAKVFASTRAAERAHGHACMRACVRAFVRLSARSCDVVEVNDVLVAIRYGRI